MATNCGQCRTQGCQRATGINPRTGQPYFCCGACRQRDNLKALKVARARGQSAKAYREQRKHNDWNRPRVNPPVVYSECTDSWWAEPLCQEDRRVFTDLVNRRLTEMRRSRFGLLEELSYGPDAPPRVRKRKALEEVA